MKHTITKSLVRGEKASVLRARCSCGGFEVDSARLSTPGRRRQDRLISEHLNSVAGDPAPVAALLAAVSIEGML